MRNHHSVLFLLSLFIINFSTIYCMDNPKKIEEKSFKEFFNLDESILKIKKSIAECSTEEKEYCLNHQLLVTHTWYNTIHNLSDYSGLFHVEQEEADVWIKGGSGRIVTKILCEKVIQHYNLNIKFPEEYVFFTRNNKLVFVETVNDVTKDLKYHIVQANVSGTEKMNKNHLRELIFLLNFVHLDTGADIKGYNFHVNQNSLWIIDGEERGENFSSSWLKLQRYSLDDEAKNFGKTLAQWYKNDKEKFWQAVFEKSPVLVVIREKDKRKREKALKLAEEFHKQSSKDEHDKTN